MSNSLLLFALAISPQCWNQNCSYSNCDCNSVRGLVCRNPLLY